MNSTYTIKLSDGSVLTDIAPLENNGLGNLSVPRRVIRIEFADPLLTGSPPAFVLSDDLRDVFTQGRPFNIVGNTGYDGSYVVDLSGQTLGDEVCAYDGRNTHVPVSAISPVGQFQVVQMTAGTPGKIKIAGIENAATVFLPTRTFTITENTLPAANTSYTTTSVAQSIVSVVLAVNVGASQWTVAGDVTAFYTVGTRIVISNATVADGEYEVASSTLVSGNTVVTINNSFYPIPSSAAVVAQTRVRLRTPSAIITTSTAVPAGSSNSGTAHPAAPVSLQHEIAPSVTSTGGNNYTVTWYVPGNITAQLIPGSKFLVNNATYNGAAYSRTFTAQTVAFTTASSGHPSGYTSIVSTLTDNSGTLPAIAVSSSSAVVYPTPPIPYGFVQYSTDIIATSLSLVGKGSAAFNAEKTWGGVLQDNLVHMTENFSNSLPPVAPLTGQLWYDKTTSTLRLWTGTKFAVTSITPGIAGSASITIEAVSGAPVVGETVSLYGNVGLGLDTISFTITSVSAIGSSVTLDVAEAIDADAISIITTDPAAPYGMLYGMTPFKGIVTTDIPSIGLVDMNGYTITELGDAVNPQDAVNLQTGDARYVNVTGDTMTDTLNITNGGNLNVSTGDITTNSGDIIATSGNLTVGGNATITGNVQISSGDLTLPVGDITLALGDIDVSGGGINIAGGDLTINNGNVLITSGNFSTSIGSFNTANGSFVTQEGAITVGAGGEDITIRTNLGSVPTLTFTSTYTQEEAIDLGNNRIVNLSTPQASTDAANKAYVDGLANGITWIESILDPNLFDDSLSAPPTIAPGDTTIPFHKTYIVKAPGTGDWAGLDGHAVTFNGTDWVSVLGRAVAVNDRFGVFVSPNTDDTLADLPEGGLVGQEGKIATITAVGPLAYTFYTPTEPDAVSVTGTATGSSLHFGSSYTFRGTWGSGAYGTGFKWIAFSGPQMLVDGAGLQYVGNVLNVGAGDGITVNSNDIELDLVFADARFGQRVAVPATSADPGQPGQWAATNTHLYIYGTTSWGRVALTSF